MRPNRSAARCRLGTFSLRGEMLESRRMLAPVVMTEREQLLLELVNRARANPELEAARFGIDLNEELEPGEITPDPKQPLAPNQALVDAARGHSQTMLNFDFFDHTDVFDKGPADRALDAGYEGSVGENIAWFGTGGPLDQDGEVYARHEALFLSPPHRTNMLNGSWREVGNGIRFGEFDQRNSIMVTENFGSRGGDYFITGVAYSDLAERDNFYSYGEGLGNVTITVTRNRDGEVFETSTNDVGGYGIQVPAGVYSVQASGPAIPDAMVVNEVVVLNINQKVDFNTRNPRLGTISGKVFNDTNRSGTLNETEAGLADRRVFLDSDDDGQWDPDESLATTDADGDYEFSGLRAGTYHLQQELPPGWVATGDTETPLEVTLAAGIQRRGIHFGAFQERVPPVAADDFATVEEGLRTLIDVYANDHDEDGELVLEQTLIHVQPAHGTIGLDSVVNQLVYEAEVGFVGTDFFVYSVADNDGLPSNEARVEIQVTAGPGTLWQNSVEANDVNQDGFLSPIDALLVLNDINVSGARRLPHPQPPSSPPPFIDVSGDGFVSPLDALLVLNELNRRNVQRQRALASVEASQLAAAVDAFWSDPLHSAHSELSVKLG